MTKVMFINAIDPTSEIQSRFPPLGLAYLASSLRNHFGQNAFEFKIVDRDVKNEMEGFRPDVVGITSVSQNYQRATNYARQAHVRKIPVIMGGIHVSSLPESLSGYVDVVVIGEGERTIIDLFGFFMKKGVFPKENLADIPGIAFRDFDIPVGKYDFIKIKFTSKREPIRVLDQIPFPARDLLRIDSRTYMFSSRGCPYRCVFCASTHFWGKMRMFSAEYVVSEIKELVEKYGVNFITFCDDLMIADVARLETIVSLLQKEKFQGKVKFSVNARASHIDEYVVRLLEKMNVVSVGMGLESGNDRVLHYLKGNNGSVSDNQKAIFTLQRHGIAANASFVIGSPEESKEEIMDTYRFIKNSGLNFVDTYVLIPFPGTPIWTGAKERGLVSDKMDWNRLEINYSKNHDPIILSEIISKSEIDRLFKMFQRLRLWIALKNIWKHPFLKYILLAIFRKGIFKIKSLRVEDVAYSVLIVLLIPYLGLIFAIHHIQKWRAA